MKSRIRKILHDNGLTLAALALFFTTWTGQFVTGYYTNNDDLREHGRGTISWSAYATSGHFIESTFENWESEFLQMGIFVILTACLYQRGSSESNPLPDEAKQNDEPQRKRYFAHQPVLRKLYENSLSIALLGIFAISFAFHLYGGMREENLRRAIATHPESPITMLEFLASSEFWFQSFQNWQSEFLSVAAMTYFTVYLRQKGSAQSKPVDAKHTTTEP